LYRLFLAGDGLSATPHLTPRRSLEELADEAGASGSEARLLLKLRECIGRMAEPDRAFLLDFAHKLATPEGGPTASGDVTACQHQSL
jgi:hypothetical protein